MADNAAERSLQGIALGRKSRLLADSAHGIDGAALEGVTVDAQALSIWRGCGLPLRMAGQVVD